MHEIKSGMASELDAFPLECSKKCGMAVLK